MTASRSRQYDVGIEEANANTLAHTSYQIYVPAVSLAMQSPSHFVSQKVLPLPSLWHVLWQSLKHCLYWSNSVWDRATWTAVANTMHSTSTTAILLAIVDSTFFFFFFLDFCLSFQIALLLLFLVLVREMGKEESLFIGGEDDAMKGLTIKGGNLWLIGFGILLLSVLILRPFHLTRLWSPRTKQDWRCTDFWHVLVFVGYASSACISLF